MGGRERIGTGLEECGSAAASMESRVIPLSRLLVAPHPAGAVVSFGTEGTRTIADLRAQVSSLASRLEPVKGGRLLLHCDDAHAFAVGLLAAAQLGSLAVLPPSRQPGALRRLAPDVAGVLLDGTSRLSALHGRPCWHPLEGQHPPRTLVAVDRDTRVAKIFTSGTTGSQKPATKALRHLEDEVIALEAQFGALLGPSTRILATMSPQHLYGLLFRVAWPLASGRPFLRSPLLHPEELTSHFAGATPFALATTPAALRHLVEKLAPHRGTCRAVFSSGGPLSAALARRVTDALGAPPWEVYGSTETGGIAVRQQWSGGEPWHPLPGVDVATEDGCLVVTSPFISEGRPQRDGRMRFVLGDRVSFHADGDFELMGRADRVVKIAEKRLSLPEMEQRLKTHPAVAEAVLVALEHRGETRVGAVIVPAQAGRTVLAESGRRGLSKALMEHLSPDFDRVLLPRVWRVVDELPCDAQGKTPIATLLALFVAGEGAPRKPEVIAVRRERQRLECQLRIPEKLAFLDGHFPSFPIVAGVVQLHFVMGALEELLGTTARLATLEALKFRDLLLPGQEFLLRVEVAENGERFEFVLADAQQPGRVFSSGRGRLRIDP